MLGIAGIASSSGGATFQHRHFPSIASGVHPKRAIRTLIADSIHALLPRNPLADI
jgi:hypothetical protein